MSLHKPHTFCSLPGYEDDTLWTLLILLCTPLVPSQSTLGNCRLVCILSSTNNLKVQIQTWRWEVCVCVCDCVVTRVLTQSDKSTKSEIRIKNVFHYFFISINKKRTCSAENLKHSPEACPLKKRKEKSIPALKVRGKYLVTLWPLTQKNHKHKTEECWWNSKHLMRT